MTFKEKLELIWMLEKMESSSEMLVEERERSTDRPIAIKIYNVEFKSYHALLDFHISLKDYMMQMMPSEVMEEYLNIVKSSN